MDKEFSYFLGGLLDELLQETRQIYEKSAAEDLLPGGMKADLGKTLTR